jgi:hypothetical protein
VSSQAAKLAQDAEVNSETGDYVSKTTGNMVGQENIEGFEELNDEDQIPIEGSTQDGGGRFLNRGSFVEYKLSGGQADKIAKKLCRNWPGYVDFAIAGGKINCKSGAQWATLRHCGLKTQLDLIKDPKLIQNGNVVKYNFKACRDGVCNNAEMRCNVRSREAQPCTIRGLSCDITCGTLSCSGGAVKWTCPATLDCGCQPGASECVDGLVACTMGCYDGQPVSS